MVVEIVDYRLHMRRNFRDVETSDKAQLHQCVCANVAEAEGTAGEFRVCPPIRALFAFLCEPSLYVGSVRPAYFAQQAARNYKARKP